MEQNREQAAPATASTISSSSSSKLRRIIASAQQKTSSMLTTFILKTKSYETCIYGHWPGTTIYATFLNNIFLQNLSNKQILEVAMEEDPPMASLSRAMLPQSKQSLHSPLLFLSLTYAVTRIIIVWLVVFILPHQHPFQHPQSALEFATFWLFLLRMIESLFRLPSGLVFANTKQGLAVSKPSDFKRSFIVFFLSLSLHFIISS